MLSSFDVSILGTLVPIFIVILSGYGLRTFRFPGDDFWPYAERLTYFVLLPCLLLQKTATARLELDALAPMLAALFAAFVGMAALLLLMRPLLPDGARAFSSFFQGGIRFNTYVGLTAAYGLFGDEGLALTAAAIALLIPLVNLLCVAVMVFNRESKRSWREVSAAIGSNPLIIACAAGIALNATGIGMHPGVSETLEIFGRASLPLGLLAVGAGLNVAAARASGKIVILNCVIKLLAMPLLMWAVAQVLNVSAAATAIAVLFAALPGSSSSYILARQLGGDSLLMANMVTAQTVLSMFTLPAVMAMLGA